PVFRLLTIKKNPSQLILEFQVAVKIRSEQLVRRVRFFFQHLIDCFGVDCWTGSTVHIIWISVSFDIIYNLLQGSLQERMVLGRNQSPLAIQPRISFVGYDELIIFLQKSIERSFHVTVDIQIDTAITEKNRITKKIGLGCTNSQAFIGLQISWGEFLFKKAKNAFVIIKMVIPPRIFLPHPGNVKPGDPRKITRFKGLKNIFRNWHK